MNALGGSVGANGKNLRDDVLTVQRLLKSKGQSLGLVDGVCGPKTISAIRKFQSTFMSVPDGLIEPSRTTWTKLSATGGPPASPQLAQWSG